MINGIEKISTKRNIEKAVCCSNKKCATRTESYVKPKFHLVDKDKMEYKCEFCDFIQKIIR